MGLHQSAMQRRRMLEDGFTGEFEQQFQVKLSGSAGNQWGWVDQQFNFEYPFLYAPLQRRSDLELPHFRSGIEFQAPTPTVMVTLHAIVIDWNRSEENWIVGAKVRFAVQCPTAQATAVNYNAIAHLAFQGYASLPEGGEFSQ